MAKKSNKNNKNNKRTPETVRRPLAFAGDNEKYAKVVKALGDRRMSLSMIDGSEMIGRIPGRLRKVRVKPGDIVLVSHREFQPTKLDILHKYTSEEARRLYKEDEIPKFFIQIDAVCAQEEEDIGFDFDDEEEFGLFGGVNEKLAVNIEEL